MTKKEFMRKVANGKQDILQRFIDLLKQLNVDYCVIGGRLREWIIQFRPTFKAACNDLGQFGGGGYD